MKVENSKPYADSQLQYGTSTWDENERSVRCAHKNRNGGFRRTSPEIPMGACFEITKFLIEEEQFSPEQLEELRKLLG